MKYKIIVDKQPRTNPSTEKQEYEIDIEELRCKGDVADSLIITKDEDYVMRRLSLSEYHVLSVLAEPVKETLEETNIKLFEGDNYIYIQDMVGNKFYAEYLVKNDFTDTYVTKNQMNSAINETAEKIELSVTKTLEGYATTEKMNSKITQTAEEINSEVSKKVGNDEIISKINQSAEKILISGDKIDIDGKAVHFKTNVSNTVGPFTTTDKEKMMNYIVGKGTLTSEEFKKYDINGNGTVDTLDLLIVAKAIANGGYYTTAGIYEINPYSDSKNIILQSDNGTYQAIISLLYNYFSNLQVGRLESTLDADKVSSSVSSNISITQENTSNNIFMQIGDWYAGKSSSGITIMNGNPDRNGDIYIIAQQDDAFICLTANGATTEIKASGITTPSLTQTSREETKKNFEKLENGLDIVKATEIYKYNLKSEEDTKKKHIGFVIGKNYKYAHEITAEDNEGKEIGVDTYSMVSVLWKAVQELTAKVEKLEQEVQNGQD